jgi:hypothetical protein
MKSFHDINKKIHIEALAPTFVDALIVVGGRGTPKSGEDVPYAEAADVPEEEEWPT